jgi:hypothetical protein
LTEIVTQPLLFGKFSGLSKPFGMEDDSWPSIDLDCEISAWQFMFHVRLHFFGSCSNIHDSDTFKTLQMPYNRAALTRSWPTSYFNAQFLRYLCLAHFKNLPPLTYLSTNVSINSVCSSGRVLFAFCFFHSAPGGGPNPQCKQADGLFSLGQLYKPTYGFGAIRPIFDGERIDGGEHGCREPNVDTRLASPTWRPASLF